MKLIRYGKYSHYFVSTSDDDIKAIRELIESTQWKFEDTKFELQLFDIALGKKYYVSTDNIIYVKL
jgi:hypothetical protein